MSNRHKKHPSNIGAAHGTHLPKSKPRKKGAITRDEMLSEHATAKQALIYAKKMNKPVTVITKNFRGENSTRIIPHEK
jgi:hypothetical protein